MKIEHHEDRALLWRIQYSDYTVVGKDFLPHKIWIEVTEPERMEMEIHYLELDITPATGDMMPFDLPVPPGVTPIPLE